MYNSKESISFVNNDLGAIGLGTHKRSLYYPFCFGDGALSKRHKGLKISEKGSRALYSARKRKHRGSDIEEIAYRESYAGRIATIYHNAPSMFGACRYTILPKDRYRNNRQDAEICEAQAVYEKHVTGMVTTRSVYHTELLTGRVVVSQHLRRVVRLTHYQSEDSLWFILRSFMFTSRTANGFVKCVIRNFNDAVDGLGACLRGKRISHAVTPLPQSLQSAKNIIRQKFDQLCNTIGLEKVRDEPGNVPYETKLAIMELSDQEINELLKDMLVAKLEMIKRTPPARTRVARLKELLREARNQYQSELTTTSSTSECSNEQEKEVRAENASKNLLTELFKTSQKTWMMKPLIPCPGMKEGCENELYVLKARTKFLNKGQVAYSNRTNIRSSFASCFGEENESCNGSCGMIQNC